MRATHDCPSCGAPQPADNPGLVSFACPFCQSVFYVDEQKALAAGKKSLLTEGFSRLYRGAGGSFHEKRFLVRGRVRYRFTRGFWDEWYLEREDGSWIWLTEDQHAFCEQQEVELDPQLTSKRLAPGDRFAQRDQHFVVQEVGAAICIGLEGALPKKIELGETYTYVDATSLDGLYSLGLEYDAKTPTAFLGRWLRYNELTLDDEGADW